MKNELVKNTKDLVVNLGWEVVKESDEYNYFTCYNPNTGVFLYIQQSSYFGLVDISTVHVPQKGHGSGWVYEKNIPEVTKELIEKAENFALAKFLTGKELNYKSLEEYKLKNRL